MLVIMSKTIVGWHDLFRVPEVGLFFLILLSTYKVDFSLLQQLILVARKCSDISERCATKMHRMPVQCNYLSLLYVLFLLF